MAWITPRCSRNPHDKAVVVRRAQSGSNPGHPLERETSKLGRIIEKDERLRGTRPRAILTASFSRCLEQGRGHDPSLARLLNQLRRMARQVEETLSNAHSRTIRESGLRRCLTEVLVVRRSTQRLSMAPVRSDAPTGRPNRFHCSLVACEQPVSSRVPSTTPVPTSRRRFAGRVAPAGTAVRSSTPGVPFEPTGRLSLPK